MYGRLLVDGWCLISGNYYYNGTPTSMLQILRPSPFSMPGSSYLRLTCNHLSECPVLRPAQRWAKPGLNSLEYRVGKQKALQAVSVCLLRKKILKSQVIGIFPTTFCFHEYKSLSKHTWIRVYLQEELLSCGPYSSLDTEVTVQCPGNKTQWFEGPERFWNFRPFKEKYLISNTLPFSDYKSHMWSL